MADRVEHDATDIRIRDKAISGLTNPRTQTKVIPRSFRDQLFKALHSTHGGAKREFLPHATLKGIVNEQSVREELSRCLDLNVHSQYDILLYAAQITRETERLQEGMIKLKSFRKIFAILALIDKTTAIIKFLQEDVSDLDLPLIRVERLHEHGAYDLRRVRNRQKHLSCFTKQWDQLHIRNFEEYQWRTLSPVFVQGGPKEVLHYTLEEEDILPFVESEGSITRGHTASTKYRGGFATVRKVEIHAEHYNFNGLKSTYVSQQACLNVSG